MNQPRKPAPETSLARPSAPTTPARPDQQPPRPPVRELTQKFVYETCGKVLTNILPKFIGREQYMASLVTLINGNPDLIYCDHGTLAVGIFHAARCGLDFNPMLGHAYLTPRNTRVPVRDQRTGRILTDEGGKQIWQDRKVAGLMFGYKGYIFLGRQSGLTPVCQGHVVYECDEFDWQLGDQPRVIHKPNLKVKDREKQPIVAAYAFARLTTGQPMVHVITMDRVDRAMQASATAWETVYDKKQRKKVPTGNRNQSSPWWTDFAAMVKKTAIRDFYKSFDLGDPSARPLAAALDIENALDQGRLPPPTRVDTGEMIPPPEMLGYDEQWTGYDGGYDDEIPPEDDGDQAPIDTTATEREGQGS